MLILFTEDSPYKKQARFIAILWTLLIFIACFIPGNELPNVEVPLIDKWVHIVLFAGFSMLWLCARPAINIGALFLMLFFCFFLGSLVEILQGLLSFLGRSYEVMDIIADTIGGLAGISLFSILYATAKRSLNKAG